MKRALLLLGFLTLIGCGDPFATCQGLQGDNMQLCIARANAEMAWRRGLGDSLRTWGAQQQQQAQQPTTCHVNANVVHCF